MKIGGKGGVPYHMTPAEQAQQREVDRACREKVMAACPVHEGMTGVRGFVETKPCFWCGNKNAPDVQGWACPGCGRKQPVRAMDEVDSGGAE